MTAMPGVIDPRLTAEQLKARVKEILWNRIMPKRIAHIEFNADHVRVLHPTKGWRVIRNKRLGL